MDFKTTKRSLAIISICCCSALYGITGSLKTVSYAGLDPSETGRVASTVLEGCPPFQQKLPTDFPLTYAAILPNSNIDSFYSLFEASGLQMINIDQSNGIFGKLFQRDDSLDSEAAIRQTQYPYINDKPPHYYDKDGKSSRASIVLNNPVSAVVARFQSGGKKKNWRQWIKTNLDQELDLYQRLVCYWLDHYTPQNRLVISYESLFSDQTGLSTFLTLDNFLRGAGAETEAASCIWRAIMTNTQPVMRLDAIDQSQTNPVNNSMVGDQSPPEQQPHQIHVANQPSIYSQYPFTAAQLAELTKMLEELTQRYKDEEVVHTILMQYQQEIMALKSQSGENQSINKIQLERLTSSKAFTEPLEICGRSIPFPLSTEKEISLHYSSLCQQSHENPKGLLLIRGYERFGRTGNNLIEFLHALEYGRENNVLVGIMLDSWPMALITKFWMAFPTDNMHQFISSEGLSAWKDVIEESFCIKVFLNDEELEQYDNIITMTSRELFMYRYDTEIREYIQFQLHNIRSLFRVYNIGVGKDIKNRNVGNLCSVIDGIFGEKRRDVKYSVVHSRSLEGAPGLRLLGILAGTSGCDPVAALNMEPEYVKAVLVPLGLLEHPILFISDNERPEILEKLLADEVIGPQILVIPPELSWVGGDLAVAIMANAFIGNPASTFSGFIAKSRIALGFDNNFLFRVKKDGEWVDSCEDRCIFYKYVMRSMA